MRIAIAMTLTAASCVQSSSVPCGDLTCPESSVCDLVHQQCLRPAQTTVCIGKADGAACVADGIGGICDLQVCLPGCGDGVQDTGEQCDDGDFASHDGCSSQCLLEAATWRRWLDPWQGRQAHLAVYHAFVDRLVVVGGNAQSNALDEQWERDASGTWRLKTDLATRLPAGKPWMGTYDSARNVLVAFGGGVAGVTPGETWEYDGMNWSQRPATGPVARVGAAIAYDPVRSRVVLFGGLGTGWMNDTWEYDGVTWTQMTTTGAPTPVSNPAMAWHPARGKLMVFGGYTYNLVRVNSFHEYSNGVFTPIVSANPPPGREQHSMAYLAATQKLVLFGGILQNDDIAADTWVWDTANGWQQVSTTLVPPGRVQATLTADATKLVLVGGVGAGGADPHRDVWEYNGTWSDHTPSNSPSPRAARLTALDSHGMLLFGGYPKSPTNYSDTWIFDDGLWQQQMTTTQPSARSFPQVAYDTSRERLVLFGGFVYGPNTFLGDTWEWAVQARTWEPRGTPSMPLPRALGSMAFDQSRGVTVLVGGVKNLSFDYHDDVWELGSGGWSDTTPAERPTSQEQLSLAYDPVNERVVHIDLAGVTWAYAAGTWSRVTETGPEGRKGPSLVYDPNRGRIVLYGGVGMTSGTVYQDLWELDGSTWTEVSVIGPLPPPRTLPGFAADRAARSLVLFGGQGAFGVLGDTWTFGYAASTPDEDCTNAMDDDGDKQVDVDDPDCSP
jgi:cysteine-rich repeat protein